MANAIHKTSNGDTLQGIAATYFALKLPDATIDDVREQIVIRGIRKATPISVLDLSTYADDQNLGSGKTLFVPTLRALNRNLMVDDPTLEVDLRSAGFEHARKLLRRPLADVQAMMSGHLASDVARAYTMTEFINLDGMDTYTAKHLFDVASITTLADLAAQTTASMDGILQALTASYGRPAELAQQDHSIRWPLEASLYTRPRLSAAAMVEHQRFPVPVPPDQLKTIAEHYERIRSTSDLTPADHQTAEYLFHLYSFAERFSRGNLYLHAGQWSRAAQLHQDARCHFHRMVEATGAAEGVDDDLGVNLTTALAASQKVLEALPPNDLQVLGAPLARECKATTQQFGLRAFRYDELATEPTDRKAELRGLIASVRIHDLPRATRSRLVGHALPKMETELSAADPDFVTGLTSGGPGYLARDLPAIDHGTLVRNVGSTPVSSSTGALDIFEEGAATLPLSEVSQHTAPWGQAVATARLSTQAMTSYPTSFLSGGVTISDRFVTLPDLAGAADHKYLVLDGAFASAVRTGWINARAGSKTGRDMHVPAEAWLSPGALAVCASWSYAVDIPNALGRAYSRLGDAAATRAHSGPRIDTIDHMGMEKVSVSSLPPSTWAFDVDLKACTTNYVLNTEATGSEINPLLTYVETTIALADGHYKAGRRADARSLYVDVTCALEKSMPNLDAEVRIGMTGIRAAILAGNYRDLSVFKVTYDDGTALRRVGEGYVTVHEKPSGAVSGSDAAAVAAQWFDWDALVPYDDVDIVDSGQSPIPSVDTDDVTYGPPPSQQSTQAQEYSPAQIGAMLIRFGMLCGARIAAIDAGVNWLGYVDDYVTPWSATHLYGIARDLCNRALDAESRVLSMLQALEQAQREEFKADQASVLADANRTLAYAQADQSLASAQQAVAQAGLGAMQADLAAQQNVMNSTAAFAGAIGSLAGSIKDPIKAVAGVVGGLASAAAGLAVQAKFDAVAQQSKQVLWDAKEVQTATAASAVAMRSVAGLEEMAADAYVAFLNDQLQLNSHGYTRLLALAADNAEITIRHANKLAWLAERALAHETRRSFGRIRLDYGMDDELGNMSRAQRLTSDLEGLRANYTADETPRRQKIKWVTSLSVVAPPALNQLRQTGECSFSITHGLLDLWFPGLYQHSLQDLHMRFVGLIPPDGVRGILRLTSVSWVRVERAVATGGSDIRDDWIKAALVTPGPTGSDPAYDDYDAWALQPLRAQGTEISLSAFSAERDAPILQAPQGMLGAAQHHGMDASFSLHLPRTANRFEWSAIGDVELTLFFLASYDEGLAGAQREALWRMGETGQLESAWIAPFAVASPTDWSDFLKGSTDGERVDLRALVSDVGPASPEETFRLVTNLLLGAGLADTAAALTVRLLCDTDPAGISLTFDTTTPFRYTDKGLNLDPAYEPAPDTAFTGWLDSVFYGGGEPAIDPQQRFVVKVSGGAAGTGWQATDEDGVGVQTLSGPLEGTNNGGAHGTATYDNGSTFLNAAVRCSLAHQGGTARIGLRGVNGYELEISPDEVRLLRSGATLTTTGLEYPSTEYLQLELRCFDQADGTARIEAWIDGIQVLQDTDATPLSAGTVTLSVVATAAGPTPVAFDDLEVVRLTGRGAEAEQLLWQPFTSSLPDDWSFVDGSVPWDISTQGHPRLDLSDLVSIGLKVDYRFKVAQ